MKSYQLLHAIEKPMNLDYAQPFSSTSDLVNYTPYLDRDLAIKKELEREQEMKQEPGQDKVEEINLEDEYTGFEVKKKSKKEDKEEKQSQDFQLYYKREHAIAYLYRKMPYNYAVYKRILHEINMRLPDFKP